jgi:very-short-patch-repair endonuclease
MLKFESPIEEEFFDALRRIAGDQLYICKERMTEQTMCAAAHSDPTQNYIFVSSQVVIGNYRADFMLTTFLGVYCKKVVVECDGHEFHRAKSEQIDRDYERDSWLRGRLIRVMRFTGKQIKRDSFACAHKVIDHLNEHRAADASRFSDGPVQIGSVLAKGIAA